MAREILSGEEALARGARSAGVSLVTSYPGSPTSATVAALASRAEADGIYVEWSCNERVALEMAIGASIAGRRALVAVKSVGMNVLVDPLMTLNLTGVHGGLVILLGDDPGAYGSQNDQDTRPLLPFVELPLVEPAGPAEAYAMIRRAFDASERFRTAVVLRITRAFSLSEEAVTVDGAVPRVNGLGVARQKERFVPVPGNAVDKHRELHAKLRELGRWADAAPWNRIQGTGRQGLVVAGFAYRKLLDVVGDAPLPCRVLKLGSLYPLPRQLLERFLEDVVEVLVLEETEPFLEERFAAVAQELDVGVWIRGKRTGDVGGHEGELFRWQIRQALTRYIQDFEPAWPYTRETEDQERPRLEGHCLGCGYGEVLDALDAAARRLGQRPILVGDPGCLVTVAHRLDAKFAMGSAVAVADGLSKAGAGERAVALFGDSSFFHAVLPAVANVVHNKSDILMVVLDNGGAVTTGDQPHPGVGRDALGGKAPAVDMTRIAQACGVERVLECEARQGETELTAVFCDVLSQRILTLLRIRIPRG